MVKTAFCFNSVLAVQNHLGEEDTVRVENDGSGQLFLRSLETGEKSKFEFVVRELKDGVYVGIQPDPPEDRAIVSIKLLTEQ